MKHILAVVVLFGSFDSLQAQAKSDQQILQGTWNVVSLVDETRPKKDADKITLIVKGNVISIVEPKRKQPDITFVLDPKKSPKWIDVRVKKDRVLKGIYEIKGDMWRMCFNQRSAGERATRFESVVNAPNELLIVLRRSK